ncbi:hypothetical protein TPHA_0H00870 [Tetrapisispora phaffii CBS 4417]|uniref:Uncharacterized protein n=1 Tax=Tetrapisispora phaffii (strain ATCC 24235 / CBS 4417 / NBRC 1672 / NRRL Y-8282 / UCD 70-5) TaxID=1071381 RepID=G8BWZ1_TETPH|nr:hypothetical protein TPHA_0H00870 [Tetrapisispora phaffii CBS 4417]CCE64295.1 hypothetical protein TPHA_0H00870 [Tetrapisispora phaffii CBS 4417]
MDDLDFTSLTGQLKNSNGVIHHQFRSDIFIIRAYKLISQSSVVNGHNMQSVINSPQTSTTTPASTTSSLNNVGSKGMTVSDADNNHSTHSNNSNNNNNNNGGVTSSINNISAQYTTIFVKLAKLYNIIISMGSISDRSSSPKSSMELYQRFKQIIKELDLSYDVSPYAQYFKRIDDGIWQIKEDRELTNDQLWQSITVAILSIYDPRTGQIIYQNRNNFGGKNDINNNDSPNNNFSNNNGIKTNNSPNNIGMNNNGNNGNNNNNNNNNANNNNENNNERNGINSLRTATTNNSPTNFNNDNDNDTQGNDNINKNGNNNINNNDNDITNKGVGNPTINSMLMDASLPQQLQKRLQSISQGMNSRSVNGYYTQPTSPGAYAGFSFNQTEVDPNSQLNYHDPGNVNIWKRKSLSSLDVDTLDDVAVEELLQLTSVNKKQKPNYANGNPNNSNSNAVNVMNFTDGSGNPIFVNSIGSNDFDNSNPVNGNQSMNNHDTKSNFNTATKQPKSKGKARNSRAGVGSRKGKNAKNNSNNNNNNSNSNNNISNSQMNEMNNMASNIMHSDAVSDNMAKQVVSTYNALILEKDQRIIQLERELELQRQETQWLRKMLIEDMGCIRSMLTNIRK